MQTKTVFSAAKYLSSMIKTCKICGYAEIQNIIIPTINPKGWVWKCDGKTPKECEDLGFFIHRNWCIEIPQTENIDFWRNYSN